MCISSILNILFEVDVITVLASGIARILLDGCTRICIICQKSRRLMIGGVTWTFIFRFLELFLLPNFSGNSVYVYQKYIFTSLNYYAKFECSVLPLNFNSAKINQVLDETLQSLTCLIFLLSVLSWKLGQ